MGKINLTNRKMAWQPYVNEMMKENSCYAAWIGGINGATWATSPTIALGARQVEIMQEDGSKKPTQVNEPSLLVEATTGMMSSGSGLWLNGEKYMIVNHNPGLNSVYIKNKTGGGTIVKTTKCILMGLWRADQSQGAPNCNKSVEDLAEKLKAANF